jgi:predicted AlkP superfamily phosphohydrolase/phosphomutase
MREPSRKQKPLYIVGIDSAPLWLLQKLKDSEGMESFRKLLKNNSIRDLESTLLPVTAASWPTIYTGMSPAEHGVPEFLVITKDYVPDVSFFDPRKNKPFYYTLAEAGFKCLVITPAMDTTIPPDNIGKTLSIITGFPLAAKANKQYLKAAMKKYKFEGEPDIEKKIQRGELDRDKAVQIYAEGIKKRARLAEHLIAKEDYDLVYICFTETDRGQHFLLNEPHGEKYLLPLYSAISDHLSKIIRIVEKNDGALMLFSDHGAQKVRKEFLINSWLSSNNYAKLKKDSNDVNKVKKRGLRHAIRETLFRSRLRDLYDNMPYHAKKVAFSIFATFLPASEDGNFIRILPSDFDMRTTRAFGAISVLPVSTIWINDRRFKNGIVTKAEIPKLKKEIIKKIIQIKNEKGERVVTMVVDGEKYYGKQTGFIPPDILFEVRDTYNVDPYHFLKGSFFMLPDEISISNHSKYGILGYYSLKTSEEIDGLNVADIHGLVLKHFGLKKNSK